MKIAFVCTENSCRSQMAEALAKKLFPQTEIEFVSAGTHPAAVVDAGAIQALQKEGIDWEGKPKSLNKIGKPDIMVTMGCDVVCPHIPGAKTVEWDIPDPKGKEIEEYHKVMQIIKEKLRELME